MLVVYHFLTSIILCRATYWSECTDGFYDDNGHHDCRYTCPKKCVSCTSKTNCTKCITGYYGSYCQHICTTECTNGTICGKDNGECIMCPLNCTYCTTESRCRSCKEGHYIGKIDNVLIGDCSILCRPACKSCLSYSICELCNQGYYGQFCLKQCSVGCVDNECDEHYGNCSCISSYTGPRCDHCLEEGKYGPPDCDRDCPATCKSCILPDACTSCYDGYYGVEKYKYYDKPYLPTCHTCQHPGCKTCKSHEECTACKIGYFGRHCEYDCSAGCNERTVIGCNTQTGACLNGCQNGLWGVQCGNPCQQNCIECEQNNGSCVKCVAGRSMHNCTLTCSDRCNTTDGQPECDMDDGACIHGCVSHTMYGPSCNKECNTHCTDKECDRYTGNCVKGCERNYYGLHCDHTCSDKCISASDRNQDSKCNESNGNCIHGCDHGWYGRTCKERCSVFCANLACNVTDGTCTAGCVIGYSGKQCQQVVNEDPNQSTIDAVTNVSIYTGIGGVLGTLVIVVATLVVVTCLRKMNRHMKEKRSHKVQDLPIVHFNKPDNYNKSDPISFDETDTYDTVK